MDLNYFDIVSKAKKRYSLQLEPICKKWELTKNEVDILLFLANNPGYDRAADIVARRGIAKSHVSMSVAALEQRGFLRFRREEADRRAMHLELTEAAAPVLREAKAAQQRYFSALFHGISPQERQLIKSISEKISGNIDAMND